MLVRTTQLLCLLSFWTEPGPRVGSMWWWQNDVTKSISSVGFIVAELFFDDRKPTSSTTKYCQHFLDALLDILCYRRARKTGSLSIMNVATQLELFHLSSNRLDNWLGWSKMNFTLVIAIRPREYSHILDTIKQLEYFHLG